MSGASISAPAHQAAVPLVGSAPEPSALEQAHIDRALNASETAISAIDTLLNISMWTLGILAILLAVIGIVGWSVIRSACLAKLEQIANARWGEYIASDEFKALMETRIDKAVKSRWQDSQVQGLEEAVREQGDPSPFPPKDEAK